MILVELCFITVSAVLIFNHILLYVILINIEVRYASLECQHKGWKSKLVGGISHQQLHEMRESVKCAMS